MAPPLNRLRQSTNHVVLPFNFRTPGGTNMDVTGATLTGKLKRIDQNPPGASVAATGTFAVVAAKTDGSYTYQPSLADTATVGEWELQVKAVFVDSTIAFDDLRAFNVVATL